MLFELNKKLYVKPFPSKIVEVEISKDESGVFSLTPTSKILILTPEIKEKMTQITKEQAYRKYSKNLPKNTI